MADTGGAAKQLVVSGGVRVNGQVETRRGHKMLPGDVVEAAGQAVVVVARAEQAYVPGTRPRASIPTRSEPTPPPRG
ncbi:MAG: hypothetical protein A2133_11200 [Actinobacteria bacterium RBG_16_64_13]|nr:MAG: hypothetical protein A2133_11200 [Actinobacteria bacterium RBG_16_64_13]